MFKYFISYAVQDGSRSGYGNLEVQLDGEIKSLTFLQSLSRDLEIQEGLPPFSIVIINYIRLE